MLKFILLLMVAIAAGSADAQVFKCKGADGKTQFSDTPCPAGSRSELLPDRAPVTRQQYEEALQRGRQIQNEAAAVDEEKTTDQPTQPTRTS